MSYYDWNPKRGDPTHTFGSWFDAFYDANRVGEADGATVDDLADTSGHGRLATEAEGVVAVQADPSTAFGAGNAGVEFTVGGWRTVAAYMAEGSTLGDATSRSIPPLVAEGGPVTVDPFTVVACIQVTSYALGVFLLPFDDEAVAMVTAPAAGGGSGTWKAGTAADLLDSAVVSDTDPHLHIITFDGQTVTYRLDGVEIMSDTLTTAALWPGVLLLGGGDMELLFAGYLVGKLTDAEVATIETWVGDNTPIVIP